ncbi:phosphoglycerate mutase family protein [Sediminibacterium sp. KACHI17]|jgi:broad specificity phosphatase PhoE|uniref:Phosphoglycerate mutase family protein n=1 Tax=Sediminibacterium sp. KACHI17 TaxID=1751071 RepID=A0AAT9GFX6_9BACT
MKQIITRFLVALLLLTAVETDAQTSTFILMRHAEKDTTAQGSTMMQADPPLSADGVKRAARIPDVLKAFQPDAIYSTNFTRTKSTVTPLASKSGKEIQIYDHRNLRGFAEELLKMQGKTVVVAGHSNSTPMLVNLLLKENKYPNLDESVYDTYWIVTVTDGKAEAKIMKY